VDHNGLHCFKTSEGTFLEAQQLSAVRLGALSVNANLGETRVSLDELLAVNDFLHVGVALLLGATPGNKNTLQVNDKSGQNGNPLSLDRSRKAWVTLRNHDHLIEP
jgi:hypothetical protein